MKLHASRLFAAIAASVLLFILLWYTVFMAAEIGFYMMFGPAMMDGPFSPIALLIVSVCVIAGVDIYQLLINRLHVRFFKVQVVIYLLALAAVVFLKSRGVQELNLDVLDLYTSFIEYPASVVINTLIFVPVGALVLHVTGRMPRSLALGLLLIMGIECSQYLLHLGICDVVDVIVCFTGYTLGCLALSVTRDLGWRYVRIGNSHARIERQKPQSRKPGKATLAAAVILVAIAISCATGTLAYDYGNYEYIPWQEQ
jgi:glycopeptide antibiotics resistance protein